MKTIEKGHSTISFHGNFHLPDNFQGSIADAFQLIADYLKKKDSDEDVLHREEFASEHDPADGFEAAFNYYLESDDNHKFAATADIDTWDGEEWIKTPDDVALAVTDA